MPPQQQWQGGYPQQPMGQPQNAWQQPGFEQFAPAGPGGRPPSKGRLWVILGLVAALVVSAGVAVFFVTSRSDEGSASGGGNGGSKAGGFDNLLTLDPCSYLEPKMFAEVADKGSGDTPQVRIEPAGFSRCAVDLERSAASGAGNAVTVMLEAGRVVPSEATADATKTTQRGSVQVADLKGSKKQKCAQFVFRPDGTAVRLSVTTLSLKEGDSTETLCKIRDIATEAVVAALTGNTAESMTYPSDSLGGTDPCTRLSEADLKSVTGAATVTKAGTNPADTCEWKVGTDDIYVNALLTPKSEASSLQTQATIAGRGTNVKQDDRGACELIVNGRSWEPWQGSHSNYTATYNDSSSEFIEQTSLIVHLPNGSGADACTKAKALAAIAWPKLPRA